MRRSLHVVAVITVAAACGDSKPSAPATGSAGSGSAGSAPPVSTPPPSTLAWVPLPASPPFLASHVRSSGQTRCAVARDGRIACWGELGGTPYVHTGVVHTATGIIDAVDAVMFGIDLCVVRRDGSGGCVSASGEAQTPAFPPGVVEIERTSRFLCARDRAGGVACHDSHDKAPFAPIAGITGATSLTCVMTGCCATTPSGVRCFGDASTDIGIVESTDGRALTVTVPPATQIAYHSFGACVRTQAGGAYCWGDATKLSRPSGVRGVALYERDLCAILDDGRIECTGGTRELAHVIAAQDSCVLHEDGSVSCTGTNLSGQLGDGRETLATTPQRVPGLENIVDLRVTETQACAVARDRSMTCWGWTVRTKIARVTGLLGGGDQPGCTIHGRELTCQVASSSRTAMLEEKRATLSPPTPIKTFSMFGEMLCVIDKARALSCADRIWDAGPAWQRIVDVPVAELDEVNSFVCARLVDGRVGCFDPESDVTQALEMVPGIAQATQLSGGPDGGCVLTRTGEVMCWTERDKLRAVEGLRGATAISSRGIHVCGLVNKELWCAGRNTVGQLGDGTRIDPPDGVAVRVKTSFEVATFAAAGQATCALDTQGAVWCWGSDQDGLLGQGRVPQAENPSRVLGIGPR